MRGEDILALLVILAVKQMTMTIRHRVVPTAHGAQLWIALDDRGASMEVEDLQQ